MKPSDREKRLTRLLSVAGAFVVLHSCSLLWGENFRWWNTQISDRLSRLRHTEQTGLKPVDHPLVFIDANFYYNRSYHARVIEALDAMGVKTLLVDFVFAENVGEDADSPLVEAIGEAGNVHLGLTFDTLADPATGPGPVSTEHERHRLNDVMRFPVQPVRPSDDFLHGVMPRGPLTRLARAADGLGFLNLTPDPDNTLRRVPLLIRHGDGLIPSLPVRVVCDFLGIRPEDIVVDPGRSITFKPSNRLTGKPMRDRIIPIDGHGNMLINDTGVWRQIPHFSNREVSESLTGPDPSTPLKSALVGKIAILAENVTEDAGLRTVTSGRVLSTGEIHAIVIHNILTESFLRALSTAEMIPVELVLLAVIFLMSVRLSALRLAAGTLALSGIYVVTGILLFLSLRVVLQFVQPLLMAGLAVMAILSVMAVEKTIRDARAERARQLSERELEIGREIQVGFFPASLPVRDGWEIASHFQAARHVAGDFYDAFSIGTSRRIGVVVADVCDKGVGAALFMALFRSFVRLLSGASDGNDPSGEASPTDDPEAILLHTVRTLNDYIATTHEPAGMFATLFFGIIDPFTGELWYVNGGHEPPAIVGREGLKAELGPTGPAVGAYPGLPFRVFQTRLDPGDILIGYTDGVTDARNQNDECFSKNRLVRLFAHPPSTAREMLDRVRDAVQDFARDTEPFDDITLIAIGREKETVP